MRMWEFEEGKGEADERGKIRWNDHITFYMSHRNAFALIHVILHQLAQTGPTGSDVAVQLLGKLTDET